MPISEFKATCLAVLERVRRTGKPLVVTKRGVPVAQIGPPPAPNRRKSGYGAMKDTVIFMGDVVSPVEDEWDVLR
jgi:prevent-host-death family protein